MERAFDGGAIEIFLRFERGGVAQLVRVPPCHGGCCGFESRLSRHFFYFITVIFHASGITPSTDIAEPEKSLKKQRRRQI